MSEVVRMSSESCCVLEKVALLPFIIVQNVLLLHRNSCYIYRQRFPPNQKSRLDSATVASQQQQQKMLPLFSVDVFAVLLIFIPTNNHHHKITVKNHCKISKVNVQINKDKKKEREIKMKYTCVKKLKIFRKLSSFCLFFLVSVYYRKCLRGFGGGRGRFIVVVVVVLGRVERGGNREMRWRHQPFVVV